MTTTYADAVIAVLIADFPDLADPDTAEVVKHHIGANIRTGNGLEIIVDNPGLANWRLIRAPHDRRRVHLACYRISKSAASGERWARLNKALDALPAPGEGEQR